MSGPLDTLTALDVVGTASVLAVDASLQIAVVLASAGLVCALARNAPARWRHGVLGAAFASTAVLLGLTAHAGFDPATWRVGAAGQAIAASVWALGFLALRARDLRTARRLERTWRLATPAAPTDGTPVRIGGTFRSPITFGWRARVLLPTTFPHWSADDRRQVLLHESAHARRGDWAVQRFATLLCHLLWFHPLPWVARRLLVLEAERAADEVVLRAGERPSDYAQLLLDRACHGSPSPALAARRWLEIRIRSLLQPRRTSGRFAAVGLLAVLCLPFALRDVTASEPPPPTCSPAEAPVLLAVADPYAEELVVVEGDTRDAAPSHELLLRRLDTLTEPELAHLHGAAHHLVRNCPYNRASAGVPVLLAAVMEPHFGLIGRESLRWVSPAINDRLQLLRDGLDAHGRLVAKLGLDPLPEPQKGDYLQGQTVWQSVVLPLAPGQTDAVLASVQAPLDQIMKLVDAYPQEVKDAIDDDRFVLDQHTEGLWPLKRSLMAYRTTLRELAVLARGLRAHSQDELQGPLGELAVDCEALVKVLDKLISMYC